MKGTYPGFYLWWHADRAQGQRPEEERVGLALWPSEPQEERVPTAPDPLDYGRIATTW
jgi:hypothetical protein